MNNKSNSEIILASALRELLELITNAENTESGKLSGNPYFKPEVKNAMNVLFEFSTGKTPDTKIGYLDAKEIFDSFMEYPFCCECLQIKVRNNSDKCWYCKNE